MASTAGPTVSGSDGSDFVHRERIASHYKSSLTNKWRMKYSACLHMALVVLMLLRLSVSLCVILGSRPPSFLQRLQLPKAQAWEFWWLASIIPSILALLSLSKNRIFLIQQFSIGTVIFGLGPVLFAIYDNLDELLSYWETHDAKIRFLGFPMVVLWNMFLTIALQVHLFGLYFAWQLMKAWQVKPEKKKI